MASLDGRRILVTGGSSGIGAAVAQACATAGARVAVTGRDRGRLEAVATGCGAAAFAADLTRPEEARTAAAAAAEALGGLDGLVNAAGVMLHSALSAGRTEDWRATLEINVLGLAHATHAVLPHLHAAGFGDVVNVASLASDRVSHPDFALYAASKAAVARLTEALRADVGPGSDIRVTAIKPGATRTPGFGPGIRDPQLRDAIVAKTEEAGMDAAVVAEQIRHVLALPRTACIDELTLVPHSSTRRAT